MTLFSRKKVPLKQPEIEEYIPLESDSLMRYCDAYIEIYPPEAAPHNTKEARNIAISSALAARNLLNQVNAKEFATMDIYAEYSLWFTETVKSLSFKELLEDFPLIVFPSAARKNSPEPDSAEKIKSRCYPGGHYTVLPDVNLALPHNKPEMVTYFEAVVKKHEKKAELKEEFLSVYNNEDNYDVFEGALFFTHNGKIGEVKLADTFLPGVMAFYKENKELALDYKLLEQRLELPRLQAQSGQHCRAYRVSERNSACAYPV